MHVDGTLVIAIVLEVMIEISFALSADRRTMEGALPHHTGLGVGWGTS